MPSGVNIALFKMHVNFSKSNFLYLFGYTPIEQLTKSWDLKLKITFPFPVIQRDTNLSLFNDANSTLQSIGKDAASEPLSTSVKDVIISTPIESNLQDPSNSCNLKNIEINNDFTVKSALEFDIAGEFSSLKHPDSQKITTFEWDPLELDNIDRVCEFEEILNEFEVNSEQDILKNKQGSIKPLQFNKRDPRLFRLLGEKK